MGGDPSEDEDEPKPTRPQPTSEWSFSSPTFGGGANTNRAKPKVPEQVEPKPKRTGLTDEEQFDNLVRQQPQQDAAPIAPAVVEAKPVNAPELFPQTRPKTPDYSELKAINEPVTAAKPQPAQAPEPAIIDTTPQGLQNILDRYAQMREAAKITPDAHDLQARQQDAAINDERLAKLQATHKTERQVTNPHQASDLAAKHDKESGLLSYEALAGQVYAEAKIMMKHLKHVNPREAARCENESLAMVSTAKFINIERRQLRGEIASDIEAIPPHVRDENIKRSAEQEAAKGGVPLTTEQRANASPDAQAATRKKDRDEKAGDRTGDQKHDQPDKGTTMPTGRGGGRSGGRGR